MITYKLWDRKEKINGVEAEHFLEDNLFKNYNGDIILILNDDKVTNVELKDTLALVYEIDVNLPLDEFMAEYFAKTSVQEGE